jgi:DNA-binding winged helix-turn-helix (wHTH) protein/TolB-like protein/tetratricopeptide (TPR) repeat protein
MNPENGAAGAVRIGEWLVEPTLNRLSRGETVVHVRPKAMDVLALLAQRPGQVVSRESIIDTVWAKTFIADSALASAISELRKALGDDPLNPTYLETIQKRGYRLVAAVEPPAGTSGTGAAAPVQATPTAQPGSPEAVAPPAQSAPVARRLWRAASLAAVALVTTLSVVAVLGWRAEPRAPVRIEVLPFENLGPPEVAYLAAGITEEIAATLASIPDLHVVVGGEDSGPPATAVATPGAGSTGVGHVLDGSVRWAGGEEGAAVVRITPRLIRVRDGATVWSRVYERSMKDGFAVQSDIAREVALHLDVALTFDGANALEEAGTADPVAHDAYLRGMFDVGALEHEEDQLRAVRMFEGAIARDPGYLAAYVALARTDALLYHFGVDRSPQRLGAARQARDSLRARAPDRPEVLVASAYVAFAEMRFDAAASELDAAGPKALFPFGRGFRADIARRLGRFEDALVLYTGWLDASPVRAAYVWEQMGATSGFLGRWDEADRAYQAALALDPGRHTVYPARAHILLLWKRSIADARAVLDRDPEMREVYQRCERWLLAICERDWDSALYLAAGLPDEGASTACQRVPRSLVLGETNRLAGDLDVARLEFEASRITLEREVAENPDDFRRYSALGIAYAGLGRRDDAVRSCSRALSLCPVTRDAVRGGFYLHDLALSQVMTGALDDAAATLETLLTLPHHPGITPVIDLDPRWAPLRSHPAFPRLLALLENPPARPGRG